jgi:acyl-CoA synthetase (AMP-forming)/AMP-acid ligase II
MARVRGRPSPITGAIVVADIVVRPSAASGAFETTASEVLEACRRVLPPHKVPAILREVASLDIAESGKLVRLGA